MKRLKTLTRYQNGVLLCMAALVVVFSVLYPLTLSREGFLYQDTVLVPTVQDGQTRYTGKLHGQDVRLTVAGQTVEFWLNGALYETYTVVEDPTAIPKNDTLPEPMTGVEVRRGDVVLFRGGVTDAGDRMWIFEGNDNQTLISTVLGDGTRIDERGNRFSPWEPTAHDIVELVYSPELTHKGFAGAWFFGVAICVVNLLSILFADELFRWQMSFRVRHAYDAEPSDWEIAGRHITWAVLPILAAIVFFFGLQ